MDNLLAHKVVGVEVTVRRAQATLLYLPHYNPNLNPIEQHFAKLKNLLHQAVSRMKGVLWDAIDMLLHGLALVERTN
ncbi:hypothetical protein F0L46_22725 [Salinarimonas soli]|uniref:Tc1-like transposase DDE domain-containing protein n=1 Tax=Salinarimonas soli TaxID=1638099 RepID=A0A5B2V954_9HYPH|nr:hypothetical protein F0L46_22725 [Salinarimonas soli]